MNDEFVTLLIRKKNGEEWELEVEKEYEDDLGVEFENSLMDLSLIHIWNGCEASGISGEISSLCTSGG